MLGLLALPAIAAGCGSEPVRPEPSGHKLMVIALTGADWRRMQPLMEQGRLPHLAALAERGAGGTIPHQQPSPPPLTWTTVATGRFPEEHGVLDFNEWDEDGTLVPVTVASRRVSSLWEIASATGLRTATVGWWVTAPATRQPGLVAAHGWEAASSLDRSWVVPAELLAACRSMRVAESSVPERDLARFLRLEDAQRRLLAGDPAAYGEDGEHPVLALRRAVASTASQEAVVEHILRQDAPDLLMVGLDGLDLVGHRFSHYEEPPMHGVPVAEQALYSGVQDAFYRYMDEVIGRMVQAAAPETGVVVLSGHGLARGGRRPPASPRDRSGQAALWHDGPGGIILAGPPFSAADLGEVRLVDVAPTLLAALGLPMGEDMAGGPVLAALSPALRAAHPVTAIPTHEGRGGVAGPGSPEPGRRLTMQGLIHLAMSHAQRGHHRAAREAYQAAVERAPDSAWAHGAWFDYLQAQGQSQEARVAGERLLVQVAQPSADRYLQVARLWLATVGGEAGQRFLDEHPGPTGHPGPWLARATLAAESGQYQVAEDALSRALDRDPSSWAVAEAWVAYHEGQGTLPQATPALRRGLAARGGDSLPHLVALGYVELTQGQLDAAADYLGRAVEMAPEQEEALLYLGAAHYGSGRYREAATTWRRLVDVAPGHLEARAQLILALARTGRIAMALDEFRAAGPAGRDSVRLLRAAAWACLVNGLHEEGLPLAQRALELDPEDPQTIALVQALAGGRAAGGEVAP